MPRPGALRNYNRLWSQVGRRFFPGQSRPPVQAVPAGGGYTYTEGVNDAAGVWHGQPTLYASPHWFRDEARRPGPAHARKDPRWQGDEAAMHEWAFERGGATTEAQAVHQENRMRRYYNRISGRSKRRR